MWGTDFPKRLVLLSQLVCLMEQQNLRLLGYNKVDSSKFRRVIIDMHNNPKTQGISPSACSSISNL